MSQESQPLTLSPAPRDDLLEAQVHVRWDVKTAADSAAAKISPGSSSPTNIATLRAAPAPANWPPPGRWTAIENTIWELGKADTTLVGYKHETDGDYHLVISDSKGDTMIVEIPDPAPLDPKNPFFAGIQASRKAFDARFGIQLQALDALMAAAPPGTSAPMIVQVSVPVDLKGLGFFDFIHGQTGVAPNGIELHPVLGIQF